MIITKEQQEKIVDNYIQEKHNTDKIIGFVDGINATIDLINRLSMPFEIVEIRKRPNINKYPIMVGGKYQYYSDDVDKYIDYLEAENKQLRLATQNRVITTINHNNNS